MLDNMRAPVSSESRLPPSIPAPVPFVSPSPPPVEGQAANIYHQLAQYQQLPANAAQYSHYPYSGPPPPLPTPDPA